MASIIYDPNRKHESLRNKTNRFFKYQQKFKKEVPSPKMQHECKIKRANLIKFTTAKNGGSTSINATSSLNENLSQSSTIHIQTVMLNDEISEQLASITEIKENLNQEAKEIMSLVEN